MEWKNLEMAANSIWDSRTGALGERYRPSKTSRPRGSWTRKEGGLSWWSCFLCHEGHSSLGWENHGSKGLEKRKSITANKKIQRLGARVQKLERVNFGRLQEETRRAETSVALMDEDRVPFWRGCQKGGIEGWRLRRAGGKQERASGWRAETGSSPQLVGIVDVYEGPHSWASTEGCSGFDDPPLFLLHFSFL